MKGVSKCSELLEITLQGFAYAMITKKAVNRARGLCIVGIFHQLGIGETIRCHCPSLDGRDLANRAHQTALLFFSFILPPTCKDTVLQQRKSRSGNQSSQCCPCHHPDVWAGASPFLFASTSAEPLAAPARQHTAEP